MEEEEKKRKILSHIKDGKKKDLVRTITQGEKNVTYVYSFVERSISEGEARNEGGQRRKRKEKKRK